MSLLLSSQCDDCSERPFLTSQQCFCSPPDNALGLLPFHTNNELDLFFSPRNNACCLSPLAPNTLLNLSSSLPNNPLGLLSLVRCNADSHQFLSIVEHPSCSLLVVLLGLCPFFDKEAIVVSCVPKCESAWHAPSLQNKLKNQLFVIQSLNPRNKTNSKFTLPSTLSLPTHCSLTASTFHKVLPKYFKVC